MQQGSKTHCPHGHAYDSANTYVAPDGSRQCRTCRRTRTRKPKTCGHCGQLARVEQVIDGSPRCKLCSQYRRMRGVDRPAIWLLRQEARKHGMKVCGRCKQVLPLARFYRSGKGTQRACKDCQRDNMRRLVSRDPEAPKRWHRRWAAKGKGAERNARRDALKLQAYVAPVDHLAIFERDRWRCGICGGKVDPKRKHPDPLAATLDHVVPLDAGGTHEPANVQCAHARCNKRKGNRGGGEQLRLIG